MKTYRITVNTSKRFEEANYIIIGEVSAMSKEQAIKYVEIARKFNTDTENVKWYRCIEMDLRPFVLKINRQQKTPIKIFAGCIGLLSGSK